LPDGKPRMSAANLVRLPLVCQLCKELQVCGIRQCLMIVGVKSPLRLKLLNERYGLVSPLSPLFQWNSLISSLYTSVERMMRRNPRRVASGSVHHTFSK
jgi:hypothetical protein